MMTLTEQMTLIGKQARAASRELSRLSTAEKNRCLLAMADGLEARAQSLQSANQLDLEEGSKAGLSGAMLDRLRLNEVRIKAMARGLREVAALPDPTGRVLEERIRPNGLRLRKITTPIGVIAIIYESRPNVTSDAASLCFKSGNATILRGGKEALRSNQIIASTLIESAQKAVPNFPAHAIQVIPTTDREAIRELLSLTSLVDLCMPRGGEGLIRAVTECSRVPVIKHFKGVCHVYVDRAADLEMALEIADNAKTQRPAVCNAMETLLVDESVAREFLPSLAARLSAKSVELRADGLALEVLRPLARTDGCSVVTAEDDDFFKEYNDYILNVRSVNGVGAAIEHINHYGSGHSDCIVTGDQAAAEKFMAEIDSATVYWNASTRFTDGGEFGMGAEIGISTDKIGARGPMGLEELTSYKWLGFGAGQVRS